MVNEEILSWLRRVVREEVRQIMLEYVAADQKPLGETARLNTAELCRELKISKQTLYNWLKDPKLKRLIEAHRQKTGGKVSYDGAGIKAAIQTNQLLFGGGRDYGYKDEVILTGAQKSAKRFREIATKILLDHPASVVGVHKSPPRLKGRCPHRPVAK